ncbi:hypothetical protein SFUMM280S_08595 [Streptomyces fumanus]
MGGDGERVRVRQGVREGAAEDGQQISAVDGAEDGPAGEVDVVHARSGRRVTAVSRSNSLSPTVAGPAGAEAASDMAAQYNRGLLSGSFPYLPQGRTRYSAASCTVERRFQARGARQW